MKLSRDLRTVLSNLSAHEDRGTHATCDNPNVRTLKRRGLIELKLRSPSDPGWLANPYLGWGLTPDGRAALGKGWN